MFKLFLQIWGLFICWRNVTIEVKKDPDGRTNLSWVDVGVIKPITALDRAGDDAVKYVQNKIKRAKFMPSRLPKPLKFIPALINILDDAQDILITALVLAKPLLRKIPGPAAKILSVALPADAILNVATNTLAQAVVPVRLNPYKDKQFKKLKQTLKDPNKAMERFLRKGGWRNNLGFALQGLQATDTLFGKGLKLGAIIGAYNDIIWDGMRIGMLNQDIFNPIGAEKRALQLITEFRNLATDSKKFVTSIIDSGKKLWNDFSPLLGKLAPEDRPPRSEITGLRTPLFGSERSPIEVKAGRLMIETLQLHNFVDIMDDEDLIMVIAAQKVATGIMFDEPEKPMDDRFDSMAELPFPMPVPANSISRSVLRAEGFNLDDVDPGLDMSDGWPTISWAMTEAMENQPYFEEVISQRSSNNPEIWLDASELWAESCEEILEKMTGVPIEEYTTWPTVIKASMKAFFMDFTAPRDLTFEEYKAWLLAAIELAESRGFKVPGLPEWRDTSVELFGTFKPKTEHKPLIVPEVRFMPTLIEAVTNLDKWGYFWKGEK